MVVGADYAATVSAKDQVNLVSLVTGRLEKLRVDVGSQVQKGQVIAELSHGTLDAQLQQAQAGLRNARAKLASAQVAARPNQINAKTQLLESEVAKARTDLLSAQVKLSQLQNPSQADLAKALWEVADAQTKLSDAQVDVDTAIAGLLSESSLGSDVRTWWQMVLAARSTLASNTIWVNISPGTFSVELTPDEKTTAQAIEAMSRQTITSLLERINEASSIPQDIRAAIWAEAAAQADLNNAKAQLAELQEPRADTVALAQAEVDSAQAALESAAVKLDLWKNPSPASAVASVGVVAVAEQTPAMSLDPQIQHDIEAAQAQADQAEAQVNLVNQQLAELRVVATFDGFITQRWLSPGALATPQTPIVTLVGKDVVVSLRVEESRVSSLQLGQPVTFTSPAAPDRLELRVERIAPAGDDKAHTFLVQMVPSPSAQTLKPGTSGRVSILTGRQDAVLVPREAVLHRDGQPFVFVVQDGKARLQKVNAGLTDEKNTEIRSGVKGGDQVVTAGQNLVKDGDRVAVEGSTERQRPPG
jgi:multidrug efflux pump subunit AcrA (membrane-fusion protein)